MKVLVLGSTGLLGQSLLKNLKKHNLDTLGLARKNADVNIDVQNDNELISTLTQYNPNVVINTIAIVDNKFCESHPDKAYLINTRPVAILADWAKENSTYFIQISTDHFYSGDKNKKHNEEDKITIVNEYARTKFLAEKLTLLNENAAIIRTNIVGFRNQAQPTFLEWALNSLKNNDKINLFNDYFTSSIHTEQLSKILIDLIKLKPAGIFNIAAREPSSKEDFILTLSKKFNINFNNYTSIGITDSNLSKRAESLGLDTSKIENLLGYKMPSMQDVIDDIFLEYNKK